MSNSNANDSTGGSIGMGVQAGTATLAFEAQLLEVFGNSSSIWPSDISTAANVMRSSFGSKSCY